MSIQTPSICIYNCHPTTIVATSRNTSLNGCDPKTLRVATKTDNGCTNRSECVSGRFPRVFYKNCVRLWSLGSFAFLYRPKCSHSGLNSPEPSTTGVLLSMTFRTNRIMSDFPPTSFVFSSEKHRSDGERRHRYCPNG